MSFSEQCINISYYNTVMSLTLEQPRFHKLSIILYGSQYDYAAVQIVIACTSISACAYYTFRLRGRHRRFSSFTKVNSRRYYYHRQYILRTRDYVIMLINLVNASNDVSRTVDCVFTVFFRCVVAPSSSRCIQCRCGPMNNNTSVVVTRGVVKCITVASWVSICILFCIVMVICLM